MSKDHNHSDKMPTTNEMMECLNRSGYLLESSIVRRLDAEGFFVEPNQSFYDANTGKSREIDIVAEFPNYNPHITGVCIKTIFVMEVINNSYPFVLMTPRKWTPNTPDDDYVRYICTPNEDHEFLCHDIFDMKWPQNWKLYSQYCAFSRKKGASELMAHHPDDVHSSIQKMSEYILDTTQSWLQPEPNKCWRVFFWKPVLVLRENLFILDNSPEGEPELIPANAGRLEYNFHYKEKPETILVDIVTEPHLLQLLTSYTKQDAICAEHIFKLKQEKYS